MVGWPRISTGTGKRQTASLVGILAGLESDEHWSDEWVRRLIRAAPELYDTGEREGH